MWSKNSALYHRQNIQHNNGDNKNHIANKPSFVRMSFNPEKGQKDWNQIGYNFANRAKNIWNVDIVFKNKSQYKGNGNAAYSNKSHKGKNLIKW